MFAIVPGAMSWIPERPRVGASVNVLPAATVSYAPPAPVPAQETVMPL
jgi:hypothetical protein